MEIDEKIKQEIRELLNRVTRADYDDDKISNFDYYIDDPKELVTLKNELAGLRRKAKKWEMVEEIAKCRSNIRCLECPLYVRCLPDMATLCGSAVTIVNALKEPT